MALCATRGRWGLGLLGPGLLGLVALPLAAQPAGAAQDCGPPAMNAVTCTAPVMGQSFTDADGITYDAGGASLTVTVNAAVTAEHVTVTGSNPAATLAIVNHGTISQTATSDGTAGAGLRAQVSAGFRLSK